MNRTTYFEDIGALSKGTNLLPAYLIGFALSLLLTVGAYMLVVYHSFTTSEIIAGVVGLALGQFVVQLICFLHLHGGKEQGTRERLIIFSFTLLIVGILVAGSIWIMFTLNERMMLTPAQTTQYMNSQSGL